MDAGAAITVLGHDGLDWSTNQSHGDWLISFAIAWSQMSLSTAFSGVGAPEHSLRLVDFWLAEVLGARLDEILGGSMEFARRSNPMSWAIELDNLARNEMLCAKCLT